MTGVKTGDSNRLACAPTARNDRGMAHHFGKSPRPSRLSVPEGANPLCKMVYAEARRQNVTLEELGEHAGVQRGTLKLWRKGLQPKYFTVESALGGLGWEIAAHPFAEIIPAGLRRDLEDVLDRFGHEIPALTILPEVAAMAPR